MIIDKKLEIYPHPFISIGENKREHDVLLKKLLREF